MWYTCKHATNIHPIPDRKRTLPDWRRAAFIRRLCLAPLSKCACQFARRARQSYCQAAWLQRPDGAQYHPRLQCPRDGYSQARQLASPSTTPRVFSRRSLRLTSTDPSQSPRLRLPDQPLDSGDAGPGPFRARIRQQACDWRSDAQNPQAARDQLETGQASH